MSTTIAKTVTSYPRLSYDAIKCDLLGKRYDLSLVFIGERRAKTLNIQLRGKSYIPNVLSLTLGKNTGEIFITPALAEREAHQHSMSKRAYIGLLFIHALLHLKGDRHGATMEKAEKQYLLKYGLH
jgi:rRNA maturation RNase YbeY